LSKYKIILIVFSLLLISGCVHKLPADALQLSPESLKNKQLQTRTFDISESESKLGLIVASKQRTAVDGGQIAGAVVIALLTGAIMHVDRAQSIRVCLVTRPGEKSKSVSVRVTFQRVVVNTANQVTKNEAVIDEDIYREFFEKLSQSVFLEANQI
jgi:hypothetical protein